MNFDVGGVSRGLADSVVTRIRERLALTMPLRSAFGRRLAVAVADFKVCGLLSSQLSTSRSLASSSLDTGYAVLVRHFQPVFPTGTAVIVSPGLSSCDPTTRHRR